MFGSGILDTVIGLMFVFLLVSLLVTIGGEMLAARGMWRARFLREGISRLLGSAWGQRLYAHPLIAGSGRDDAAMQSGKDGPSYIPSRSFANVVMRLIEENSTELKNVKTVLHGLLDAGTAAGADLDSFNAALTRTADQLRGGGGIGAAAAVELQRRLDARQTSSTRAWLTEVEIRVHDLTRAPQPLFANALTLLGALVNDGLHAAAGVQELRSRFDAAVATLQGPATQALRDELTAMGKRLQGPYTVGDAVADVRSFSDALAAMHLRQLLEQMPEEHTRKILLTLFDDAGNDIEKFKENIEVWFNNGMDRVNGWYKRHSQWAAFIMASIVVLALNVDALAIFKHLQTDQGARAALAAQAAAYVEAQKTPAPATAAAPAGAGPGDAAAPAGAGAGEPSPAPRSITSGVEYKQVLQVDKADTERKIDITPEPRLATVTPSTVTLAKGATAIEYVIASDSADKPSAFTLTFASNGTQLSQIRYTLKPSLDYQFDGIRKQLLGLSLPIGWVGKDTASPADEKKGLVLSGKDALQLLRQHWLGWLITALAATLGAPFWFDMLNRVISIRNAGRAPEEEPKAPRSVSAPLEPGQSPQQADRERRA